jgi:tRNA A-37 threonylcarbamoyl transferase component Bud32/tetratricopeptide (TPR) repeat protein
METKDEARRPSPELRPPPAWRDIDALFDRALDEPDERRVEWVRANAPTPAVAGEVLSLLAAVDRAGLLDEDLPSQLVRAESAEEIMARLAVALEGRYRIDTVLGQGGAATVFLAHERKHDRPVVLKVLRPEVARWIGAERFLGEIQILAKLSHPHILALIDSGSADGLLYYVMPYVGGETLRDRLARGPLSPDEARPLLRDIAAALAHAHEQQLVHRDLKPDNILIVSGHAFLMDFGIAKIASEIGHTGETMNGFAVGTPVYMAPEQAAGLSVDVRADLYSWGIVASEALSGNVIRGDDAAKAAPRPLRRIIDRCLRPYPADRPANGEELLKALDAMVEQRPQDQRRARWTAAIAVLVVSIVAIGVSIRSRSGLSALSGPVMVTPLTNETGDTSLAVWGRMAGDWLTQGLHQTGRVAVVPWPVALQAVAAVRSRGDERLKDLAAETGAQAVITGAYYRNGPTIRLQAQVTDVNNGTMLAALPAIEVPADSIREGIQQLRDRLMAVFAIRSDQRLSTVPGLIDQPPTYDAYRLFERGIERFNALDYSKAVADFLDAWHADTAFTVPLVYATMGYLNLGDFTRGDSLVKVLRAKSATLNPYHELTLRYMEAMLAGDSMQALELARQAAAIAPGGRAQYTVAMVALSVGQIEDALKTFHEIVPERGVLKGWAPYWYGLSHAQHLAGDLAVELETTEEMRRLYPDSRAGWVHETRVLAALGRVAAVDSVMNAAAALPPDTYWSQGAMFVIAGEELEAHGHQGAQKYYDLAIAWLANQLARDPSNRAHRYWMGSVYLDRGAPDDASPYFESLAHDYPDNVQYRGLWGVTAALAGDTALARQRLGTAPAYRRGEALSYLARYAGIAGDTERAIALWSEAESAGLSGIVWLHGSARRELASLQHDSRFRKLRIIPPERTEAR